MTLAQAEGAGGVPPTVGLEAQLTLLAFLVVILVVPWLLARDSARQTTPARIADDADSDPASFFASERERRLWIWTAVVLLAIYATLSPAQEIAAALRERNLLGVTTGAALLLIGLAIAVRWAKSGPGTREIGAGLGVFAVYLVTLIRLPVPEARSHLFEYGLVAMLIYQALTERRRNGRRVPVPPVLAFAATALLGWLDEVIQIFLPNRVYDFWDVGLNAAFGALAIVASLFVGWARRLDVLARLGLR